MGGQGAVLVVLDEGESDRSVMESRAKARRRATGGPSGRGFGAGPVEGEAIVAS
jgi:hypothetical protein